MTAVTAPSVAPMAPPTAMVPPASVPLGFLAAAAVGLLGFAAGLGLAASEAVTAPTNAGVVSAVHLGVLAFESMAVLGALHQFGPVVGRRPLRSVAAARVTLVGFFLTAWGLPTGFAHGPDWLVPAAGIVGGATVLLAVANLSGPLGRGASGVPVWGLRAALVLLVVTVSFGIVYALNRELGWFPLYSHRLLAHVHLGLLGWLGLTYVAVAEKLWPMFLLAHRPRARSGVVAVAGLALGVPVLATGLLLGQPALALPGGVGVGLGLAGHVVSLVACVRHRRRPLELLHVALFVSTAFLLVGVATAIAAGVADVSPAVRARLVATEVAALGAWIGTAIVGHVHKIVPFIGYSILRADGIQRGPGGGPLLFSDLNTAPLARVTVGATAVGFTGIVGGVATRTAGVLVAGTIAVGLAAVVAVVNLGRGPQRVRRAQESS